MIFSKSRIRPMALFAITMLLLCQTVAAAQRCSALQMQAAQVIAQIGDAAAPCHQDAQGKNDPVSDQGCLDRCPARDASLETGEFHLPAAQDLNLTVLALAPPPSSITFATPHPYLATHATPPPLILVYCRLLN